MNEIQCNAMECNGMECNAMDAMQYTCNVMYVMLILDFPNTLGLELRNRSRPCTLFVYFLEETHGKD